MEMAIHSLAYESKQGILTFSPGISTFSSHEW
jgi:hypothetical protein